ncbi:hypothetical protein [Tenacibaculum caenipelagi]|uniref:Uncharacterized protein n=1 Tax=Tenacibaculum caenipelagi TaxID=1325435 RepID=A0A4R6TFU1_9FLAO|nr:hypothetical protein [Tenacibaculum caenipelagi]TDQ23832.1 hypothetical protein DFQ07_2362 [Tenacibaculum caenipelagi]
MNKSKLLDDLISQGEKLTDSIYHVPAGSGVLRFNSVYSTRKKEEYQNWQSSSQRFIKTYFPSDLEDFRRNTEQLSPNNHQKMMGILRAIKLMPEEPIKTSGKGSGNTNITINNTQQIVLNLFTEAVKDEITGKEYKELKEILKNYEREPEKTTSEIKEKLKKMGGDVLTNIITNILTNPNIYGGLM